MPRRDNLVGLTHDRLTVIGFSRSDGAKAWWIVRCACGRQVEMSSGNAKRRESCGCLHRERFLAAVTSHGMSRHPAYQVWADMRARCENSHHVRYADWGGRGVKICREWSSFDTFWRDMGPTYKTGLQIERKDNDGDYIRENCRWATAAEQQHNKRNSVFVDTEHGLIHITEAVRISGLPKATLMYRHRQGWPAEQMLQAPHIRNRWTQP